MDGFDAARIQQSEFPFWLPFGLVTCGSGLAAEGKNSSPQCRLLLLFAALSSLERSRRWFSGLSFLFLALLLLPATRQYVLMEGGTMPMVFFVTLGTVLCAIALLEQNRAYLSNIPGFLLMMTARWFVSPTLADSNSNVLIDSAVMTQKAYQDIVCPEVSCESITRTRSRSFN